MTCDSRLPSSEGLARCLTKLASVFDHSCPHRERKAPWSLEYTYQVESVYIMHALLSVGAGSWNQRQQHHQDLLEVKCSGPLRPALLELRVCVCVERGMGSSYLCAKKPSGCSGEFRPTEMILRNKAMKTGRGLFFPRVWGRPGAI